jgi:hypothetical protein
MKSVSLAAIATLVLSCLTLTKTATASSVEFSNSGGTLSGSSTGLSLTGSTLIGVKGLNGGGLITGNDLGSLSFTTGALTSGSLALGGMFAGGTFTVIGNGTNGIPNGTLFSGTFSGPVSWTLATLADGTHNYVLSGVVTGMMGGTSLNGFSFQLSVNTGTQLFSQPVGVASGDTVITSTSVPEPSTLALLAAGSLSMLTTIRRKPLVR